MVHSRPPTPFAHRHLAVASFDRTVAIWEVQGGVWEDVALLEGHESEVRSI